MLGLFTGGDLACGFPLQLIDLLVTEKREKRKRLFDMLRLKRSDVHNRKLMEEKKGELILGRRPQELAVKEYGPCLF